MKLAASLHRNCAASAISIAVPTRPTGVASSSACAPLVLAISDLPIGVAIMPGEMLVIRTPLGPQATPRRVAILCTAFLLSE